MSQRFVITGTGRSGTQYCSEVLNACHIRCGHQAVYRHEQTLGRRVHWGSYHGDSSFEAVPMLGTLHPAVLVITITREPLATIRSWRSKGLFVDRLETWEKWGLLTRVLDKHFPEVLAHEEPMGAAARFWTQWLKAALDKSHKVQQLETLTTRKLLELVDRPAMWIEPADGVPTNVNCTPPGVVDRGPHCLADLPEDTREPLQRLASRLGYEVR